MAHHACADFASASISAVSAFSCLASTFRACFIARSTFAPMSVTATNAIAYTKALRKLADAIDFIFIDCINILKRQPLRQILEHDGFHLTLLGHELVGQAIAESIVTDFIKRVEIRNSAA